MHNAVSKIMTTKTSLSHDQLEYTIDYSSNLMETWLLINQGSAESKKGDKIMS